MKKILYLAVCSLLLAGLIMCFAACGGDEDTEGSSSKSEASSNSTVDSSTASTDSTGSSTTDSSVPSTDSSVPSTDSSVPSTDSSVPSTDSSVPSTDSSVPSTDSSVKDPVVDEHQHTYSDKYSYDAQNHYYSATCDHKGEVTGVEAHEYDENGDCKCGYHMHVFSSEYSYDSNNHFNKATCAHTEEIANVEEHNYNEDNVCKCGKVKDVIEDVIALIIANKGVITNGVSVQTTYNHILNSVSASEVIYKFYENYVYVRQEEDYVNEYYYSYDNGKLTAIFVQNGTSINIDEEASEENLEGARYLLGCVDDYETFACGVERLLEYFYKSGIEKASDVFVATKNGNEYTMVYGFCIVDDWVNYYYQVGATFTVDEATGTLATAYITVDRYANDQYTVVDGKYILNEDAAPNHQTTFEIEQSTEALEDVENPYDSSKILLDSITIKDNNGVDIEETVIKLRADDEIKLFLADITPSTALLSLCDIEIIVKDEADGKVVGIDPFFNSYNNSYSFHISVPGVYEISVRVNDVTFVTTAEISAKIPSSISALVYDATSGVFDKTKKAEVYAGAPLYIVSYVDSGYDGSYVATIIGDNAANASLADSEIDGIAATVFTANVLGDYTVVITSAADSKVSCQLTVTVVEAPSVDDLLDGEYFINDNRGNKVVSAIFDSENSLVDVIYSGLYGEEETQLSYSVIDGAISFEVTDGDEFVEEFYVNELYQLVMVIYDEKYVLEQVKIERVLVSSGTMSVEDIANSGKYSGTYAFELYSTGEFVLFADYSKTKNISMSKKNGEYRFKFAGSEAQNLVKISGEDLAGSYSIENVVNVTITVDDEATLVMEPQYGTLEVIDHVATTADRNKSFVYGYEIIDGEFVFYRYGEVTENVALMELGGEYSFKFENLANFMVIEKVTGADDVLGGEYVIEKYMPTLIRFAEIIITPGAAAPQKPIVIEDAYGTFMLEDKIDGTLSGTYNYEIVNGEFVVYKDGALVTDIVIVKIDDETYSIQCGVLETATVLDKVEGEEFALAGYYEAYTEIELAYGITFVPGLLPDEETTGYIVIEDNYNGTVGGTYTYEIVEGAFVIYKDGVVTNDVLIIENIDGTYLFQCVGIVPQTLVKVEGMSVLLEGTYNVNGETGALYVITFTPCYIEKEPVYVEEGTLEIVDNNNQTVGGSYTYKVTEDGEIRIYKDGERTNDIIISIGVDGSYTFQCQGLNLAQNLIKVKGENGMLSGGYRVLYGTTVKYELLFLKTGYELPVPQEQELVLGENTIVVSDAVSGAYVTFVPDATGNLTVSPVNGEGNIKIYIVNDRGESLITIPFTIKLSGNQEVVFKIVTADGKIGKVELNLSIEINLPPEIEGDDF